MTLPRFVATVDAVEQIQASERIAFVSDMASVVASAFAKKGKNPLGDHLDTLEDVAKGGLSGNPKK